MEIPAIRKKELQAMAKDCSVEALKKEIPTHERNIKNFETAIEREQQTIIEYEYMIAVRETREGG